MRRIIFLNRYFHPDLSATSQMLSDLAFHLARHGVEVVVLTSRQRYEDSKAPLPRTETLDGVRIRRLWSTRFGRATVVGRLLDYASFYVATLLALIREPLDRSIVVAKTDPPLISVVAALAIRFRGGILVNWIQDLFPEVAEELGVIRKGGVVARVTRWARNRSLRAAQLTVVPGELLARRAIESGGRAEVIHNWADGEKIQPLDPSQNRLRRSWNLEHALVVSHSGNLGKAHDWETILGAIQRLASTPRIVFLFIGGGTGLDRLREAVSRLGLNNVQFQPYQPRDLLRESLGVADIHLVSLRPELEGMIVPSKFYGIAAAGRPTIFIGRAEGEIGSILTRYRCGIVVRPGADEDLSRAIVELMADEPRAAMGRAARAAFEDRFSATKALDAWTRLLEKLAP